MFYDLNLPWSPSDQHLSRTLAFAYELGYNVVALNHSISGKLPANLTSPIPSPLPQKDIPSKLTVLRRVTLILTENGYPNAQLAALAKEYDLIAIRPIDERTLQLACSSLDCDVISLDFTQRLPFFFKYKTLSEAIKAGKRFEICYSQGVLGDAQARRNLISNATQLIRASRGRGLILSSETKAGAVGLRGPWDAINLAAVWGLGQERGYEGMSKECRSVVITAQLKRTSYRGVIDVVYGGEKPEPADKEKSSEPKSGQEKQRQKRKAEVVETKGDTAAGKKQKVDTPASTESSHENAPISKREAKRRAKAAKAQVSTIGTTLKDAPATV